MHVHVYITYTKTYINDYMTRQNLIRPGIRHLITFWCEYTVHNKYLLPHKITHALTLTFIIRGSLIEKFRHNIVPLYNMMLLSIF